MAKGQTAPRVNEYPVLINKTVYGEPLLVKGYIAVQYGEAIQPPEVRGLLVRIRDVAIGSYDRTLLGYPFVEGPRFDWISGELYVRKGLEDALTASRESFDTLHPHFEQLQEALFALLHEEIFPDVYRGISARTRARREADAKEFMERLPKVLRDATEKDFRIRRVETESDKPVVASIEKRTVLINENYSWPRSLKRRSALESIAIAYEVARVAAERNAARRRELFYEIIKELI